MERKQLYREAMEKVVRHYGRLFKRLAMFSPTWRPIFSLEDLKHYQSLPPAEGCGTFRDPKHIGKRLLGGRK